MIISFLFGSFWGWKKAEAQVFVGNTFPANPVEPPTDSMEIQQDLPANGGLLEELMTVAELQRMTIRDYKKENNDLKAEKEECLKDLGLLKVQCDQNQEKPTRTNQAETFSKEPATEASELKQKLLSESLKFQKENKAHEECVANLARSRKLDGNIMKWEPLSDAGFKNPFAWLFETAAYVPVPDTLVLILLTAIGFTFFGKSLLGMPRKAPVKNLWTSFSLRIKISAAEQICRISNKTGMDLDMSGCVVQGVDDSRFYEFAPGFLLANGTSVNIRAGTLAAEFERLQVPEYQLYDSRTCPDLFWTADEIWESGQRVVLEGKDGENISHCRVY